MAAKKKPARTKAKVKAKAKAKVKAKTKSKTKAKAKAKIKAKAKVKPPPKVSPPAGTGGTVSVRMYRGLLGDFFFVQHKRGERTFKMLIDCGVLQCIGTAAKKPSTSLGKERIKAAIDSLMEETGGDIDLVVATHEHYDHLSGFILGKDAFKDLKIGEVWMAWTEDRGDKMGNGYREKKNKALRALTALTANPAFATAPETQTVTDLLQFYGGIESGGMALTGLGENGELKGNASMEAVLEWLKMRVGPSKVSYLEPGQMVRWGLGGALRAYVLGPPRDDGLLRRLNPSKAEGQTEVYLTQDEDIETVHGLAALHGKATSEARTEDQPFARPHHRPYGRKKSAALKTDAVVRLYERGDVTRRIERDWLGSAESLALKIDGDVNNTSLALALELPGGEILLFPADAQVGNWLSWVNQDYPTTEDKDGPVLTMQELFARTIFYKVGHHASHNATLREQGLELMTDHRLCAMIPVVEKTAKEQGKGWRMPYVELYTRLQELTQNRIIRGDGNRSDETDAFGKDAVFSLDYGPDFKANDPLWVELETEV